MDKEKWDCPSKTVFSTQIQLSPKPEKNFIYISFPKLHLVAIIGTKLLTTILLDGKNPSDLFKVNWDVAYD